MTKAERKRKTKANQSGATRSSSQGSVTIPWRRLFSTCIGLALAVGFVIGAGQVLRGLDQPLRQINVSGQLNHLSIQKIEHLVQQRIDEGLFAADLAEVRELLLNEPWLAQVAVRRKWPDLIHIELVEHEPFLRWNQEQLMTEKGIIFKPAGGVEPFQLPVLSGNYASRHQLLERYIWLSSQLTTEGIDVIRLQKEQRGAWRVQITGGSWVYMGRDAIEEKLIRFKKLYRKVLQSRLQEIERVDLRYTHGVSVSWKQDKQYGQDKKSNA